MDNGYIVFFDSGVGGLTLLAECARRFPGEDYLYYGDNANAPYGGRSGEEILSLVRAAFGGICAAYPVRAAVIACNTATAVCIDALRAELPFPVVGVEPALRPAVRFAAGGEVLLLATRATLGSTRVGRLIASCGSAAIRPYCPGDLAGEIEKNIFRLSRVHPALPEGQFAAAVLGCTHYVWLKDRISSALRCPVFDGNAGAVSRLAQVAGLRPEGEMSGTADHRGDKTNVCSGKVQKMPEKRPFFAGSSAKKNEKAFYRLIF